MEVDVLGIDVICWNLSCCHSVHCPRDLPVSPFHLSLEVHVLTRASALFYWYTKLPGSERRQEMNDIGPHLINNTSAL